MRQEFFYLFLGIRLQRDHDCGTYALDIVNSAINYLIFNEILNEIISKRKFRIFQIVAYFKLLAHGGEDLSLTFITNKNQKASVPGFSLLYVNEVLIFIAGYKGCSFLIEPSLGLVLKSSFCNFNCLNDPLRYWSV